MGTGVRETEQEAASSESARAAANGLTAAPGLTSPDGVRALQRQAGNRAVARLLAREPLPKAEPVIPVAGERAQQEYEFKIEPTRTKTDRTSFSLRFAVLREVKGTKIKGEDTSATIAPLKDSLTLSGGKLTHALALAAAKADWTLWEPWPGVKFQADLKALEAKLEERKVDVNALVVALQGSGTVDSKTPDTGLGALARTLFAPALAAGLMVKFTGRFEVKVDPHDAVKLARIANNARLQTETTVQATKLRRHADTLRDKVASDRKLLGKYKGSKRVRAQIKERIAKNEAKIARLTKKLESLGPVLKRLAESTTALKGALKSKAGRLVGMLVTKVATKALLKLIPFVNVVFLVVDIAEVSWKIYLLATGQAKLGWPSDDEGGTGEAADDSGTAPEGTGDTGTAQADSAGDTGEPVSWESVPDDQLFTPAEQELMADIVDTGAPPELHPSAQAVIDALKDEQGHGVPFTPEDLADLNAIVPQDLPPEELAALVDRLRAASARLRTEPTLDALGDINEAVRAAQTPPLEMVVEDAAGQTTILSEAELESGAGDTGTGESAQPAPKPPVPDAGHGPGAGGPVSGGAPTVQPLAEGEAEADTLVQRSFSIVSGLDRTATKSPAVFPLTVDVDVDGKLQRVTMQARVVGREQTKELIRITVENVHGWKAVQGDRVIATMRPGATVVFTWKL